MSGPSHSNDFEDWLRSPVDGQERRETALALSNQYRVWSACLERRAQQRKLAMGRINKYPVLARLGLGVLYDAFQTFSLGIELALKGVGCRVGQRRKHHALQNIRQGEVLGHYCLKGLIKGHRFLSVCWNRREKAESGAGDSPPSTSAEGAK